MAVHWVRLGIDPTGVPDTAATIDRRIGVDALAVMARARHADAVVVARHRCEIAHDNGPLVLLPELSAHEQQLLTRMRPHESKICPQIGEALPAVAGHAPQ